MMDFGKRYYGATNISMGHSPATCDRCGSAIVNWYKIENYHFGSECIKRVTGIPPKDIEFRIKQEKRENDPKWIEQMERAKKFREEFEQRVAKFSKQNEWLVSFLKEQSSDFCSSIAEELTYTDPLDLSEKVYNIIGDIWAKANGGRAGGTKFEQAWDEFLVLTGAEVEDAKDSEAVMKWRKVKDGYKATLQVENGDKIEVGVFAITHCKEANEKAKEIGWTTYNNHNFRKKG